MKEKRNVHLKVQELCDCYAANDPLKEMSILKNDQDKDEAALKWLALAALHGVNNNAKKVSITRSKDGEIIVKGLPFKRGQTVEVIVFPQHSDKAKRKALTVGQLRKSGIIGLWKDRQDIQDGANYARELRERAQIR